MKKLILFVFCSLFLLIGCENKEIEEDKYTTHYDLSNPNEKAFSEFINDKANEDLNTSVVNDNYIRTQDIPEKEFTLYKLTGKRKEDLREDSVNTSLYIYKIGRHNEPYKISVTYAYGDKKITKEAFQLPQSNEIQTLYFCLDYFKIKLAHIENDKISAFFEEDMNEFVGFDIYCDDFELKRLHDLYPTKINDKEPFDMFLYYIRTKDEVSKEDGTTDKKLFITLEAEKLK